jgi:glycosyltransferase involved in cell wall biosynthesis
MNKILSIVIPTYNMELYLSQCLNSVLLDELLDKIEIIIVNDGSTDNSLAIANTYKEWFPNSVVVIDKPNGHYGSCVNAALKAASGTYFRILDADDCFDSAIFIKFVNFLEACEADMILSNFSKDYISGGRKIAANHASERYIKKLLEMHAITYRMHILHNAEYKQLEGICYTDTEYCFYPLSVVKSHVYFDEVLYHYTLGREGQTVNVETFYKNRNHALQIIQRMIGYLQQQSEKPVAARSLQYCTVIRLVFAFYRSILSHRRNEQDEDKMREIDCLIKTIDIDLYKAVGEKRYLIFLKPVKLWRNKNIYMYDTNQFRFIMLLARITKLVLKR